MCNRVNLFIRMICRTHELEKKATRRVEPRNDERKTVGCGGWGRRGRKGDDDDEDDDGSSLLSIKMVNYLANKRRSSDMKREPLEPTKPANSVSTTPVFAPKKIS